MGRKRQRLDKAAKQKAWRDKHKARREAATPPVASPPPRNFLVPPTPEEITKWREEAAQLRAEVLARIPRLFKIAVRTLGDKEGRLHWKEAEKKQPGRKAGSTRPEQDETLLEFYDKLVAMPERPDPVDSLARVVGQTAYAYCHEYQRPQFGPTPAAITRRLRRLLTKRAGER